LPCNHARVAELADALDSKSSGGNPVRVQVPPLVLCGHKWSTKAWRGQRVVTYRLPGLLRFLNKPSSSNSLSGQSWTREASDGPHVVQQIVQHLSISKIIPGSHCNLKPGDTLLSWRYKVRNSGFAYPYQELAHGSSK
jgi:hypothetical protein